MPYEVDEVGRIQRRIEKAKRRIERNYQAPPGKETEQHRIERLEKRLADIKAEHNDVPF
jgi:polyhydroxyalkanoate synthesis regulator phasin